MLKSQTVPIVMAVKTGRLVLRDVISAAQGRLDASWSCECGGVQVGRPQCWEDRRLSPCGDTWTIATRTGGIHDGWARYCPRNRKDVRSLGVLRITAQAYRRHSCVGRATAPRTVGEGHFDMTCLWHLSLEFSRHGSKKMGTVLSGPCWHDLHEQARVSAFFLACDGTPRALAADRKGRAHQPHPERRRSPIVRLCPHPRRRGGAVSCFPVCDPVKWRPLGGRERADALTGRRPTVDARRLPAWKTARPRRSPRRLGPRGSLGKARRPLNGEPHRPPVRTRNDRRPGGGRPAHRRHAAAVPCRRGRGPGPTAVPPCAHHRG